MKKVAQSSSVPAIRSRGCVARIDWPAGWCCGAGWRRGVALFQPRMLPLPFKLNQSGRHHIPRQKRKVTNWAEYDASLRQRGSLTVWFTEEAIAAWAAETPHHPGRTALVLAPGDP